MINYNEVMSRYGISPKGVVHIGAFLGEEEEYYRRLGFNNRLFIEAQPDTFTELSNRISSSGAFCENFAVSDRNGTASFHVATNGQSSSLLKLSNHLKVYPTITEIDSFEVNTIRLDDLLSTDKYKEMSFNFANIDTQGAELLVLSGACFTLKNIDILSLEVNFDELYEGAPHIRELDAFLSAFDFVRIDTVLAHATWGDAMYIKNRFTKA